MSAKVVIPISLFIVNLPLFLWMGKKVFGGWQGFWDHYKWNFVPDIFSLFTGRFLKDMHGEMKSGLFLTACMAIYFIQLIIIVRIFM